MKKIGAVILFLTILVLTVFAVSHSMSPVSSSQEVIAEIASTTKPTIPNIDKTPPSQIAERDKLLALLDPKDPNTIFTVIDTIEADPNLAANCHEIAHDIGHRAYQYYGFSDAMTFDNPNHVKHALVQNICAGGYMHGILEEMSLYQPGFMQRPEIVCDQVPTDDARASCFHGMGHVFMLANDRDAPASIIGCRVIEQPSDMYRCFEGVRMEQFWGGPNSTSSAVLGWDPENPLATCTGVQLDEKPTCFLYATFGYLRIHPRDYVGAASLCSKSGLDGSDDHFCLKGLGMTMMSKFKGQNMEQSENYVQGLSDTDKESFYLGVMGYAHLSGLSEDELKNVCSLLKTDSLVCQDALSLQGNPQM